MTIRTKEALKKQAAHLAGEMMCSIGDYLIKEPFPTDWRKLYPCKPEIFESTYELVEE